MSVQGFGWATDPIRAAGGRAHYNALRRGRAYERQRRVGWLWVSLPGGFHGRQAEIARTLGVSEATVSRDLAAVYARDWAACEPRACGHRPLPEWPADVVAAALRDAGPDENRQPAAVSPAAAELWATTDRRTVRMMVRLNMVADLIAGYGLPHGMRSTLAAMFNVSEATMSRDVDAVTYEGTVCDDCGHVALHDRWDHGEDRADGR